MINFILGLIIGFLLGASRFKKAIINKIKSIFKKTKKEVENTFRD